MELGQVAADRLGPLARRLQVALVPPGGVNQISHAHHTAQRRLSTSIRPPILPRRDDLLSRLRSDPRAALQQLGRPVRLLAQHARQRVPVRPHQRIKLLLRNAREDPPELLPRHCRHRHRAVKRMPRGVLAGRSQTPRFAHQRLFLRHMPRHQLQVLLRHSHLEPPVLPRQHVQPPEHQPLQLAPRQVRVTIPIRRRHQTFRYHERHPRYQIRRVRIRLDRKRLDRVQRNPEPTQRRVRVRQHPPLRLRPKRLRHTLRRPRRDPPLAQVRRPLTRIPPRVPRRLDRNGLIRPDTFALPQLHDRVGRVQHVQNIRPPHVHHTPRRRRTHPVNRPARQERDEVLLPARRPRLHMGRLQLHPIRRMRRPRPLHRHALAHMQHRKDAHHGNRQVILLILSLSVLRDHRRRTLQGPLWNTAVVATVTRIVRQRLGGHPHLEHRVPAVARPILHLLDRPVHDCLLRLGQ